MLRMLSRQVRPRALKNPLRSLYLHEADSKYLMGKNGIPIESGRVVGELSEVKAACEAVQSESNCTEFYIKSQVLTGGRMKGSFPHGGPGIVKASSVAEAEAAAASMLGQTLTTVQAPNGVLVRRVFITEAFQYIRELYLCLLLNRATKSPLLIASTAGGIHFEQKAMKDASLMHTMKLSSVRPPTVEELCDLTRKLDFREEQHAVDAAASVLKMYEMSQRLDITQFEVNPWVETECGKMICLDAKLNFDDSAEYRQPEVFAMKDAADVDPRDAEAQKHDLNYIGLDGSIGCLVNGAGLAMATMDILNFKGGSAANFLDVGGGANMAQTKAAFELLQADAHVKSIFVNIFGGIVDCAMIARGVIEACKSTALTRPLVVRLVGSNEIKARTLLSEYAKTNPLIYACTDFDEAAELAVKLSA